MVIYVTSIRSRLVWYLMKLSLSAGFVVKTFNVIKVSGTEMSFAAFNSFPRLPIHDFVIRYLSSFQHYCCILLNIKVLLIQKAFTFFVRLTFSFSILHGFFSFVVPIRLCIHR